jgi:hypothetical protein
MPVEICVGENSVGIGIMYDPFKPLSHRIPIYVITCKNCDFEFKDCVSMPTICPCCNRGSFERGIVTGSTYDNAIRAGSTNNSHTSVFGYRSKKLKPVVGKFMKQQRAFGTFMRGKIRRLGRRR